MKQLPIYIIIVLLIAVLVFKCDSKPSKVRTITNLIEHTDTIVRYDTIEHNSLKIDTIVLTNTDTIIKGVKFNNSEYHYKINDSVLDGTIVAKSPFKPDIDFNYTIKNHTIKDSVYLEKRVYKGFYYGGEIVVQPLLSQMFIGVSYQDNKAQIFDLSVGRDFQNESNIIKIGYKKRF